MAVPVDKQAAVDKFKAVIEQPPDISLERYALTKDSLPSDSTTASSVMGGFQENARRYTATRLTLRRQRVKALQLLIQFEDYPYSREALEAAQQSAQKADVGGSLMFNDQGELEYTPGKYGDLGYRAAAIAVLERYYWRMAGSDKDDIL